MKIYEFELVLASGDVNINSLPNDPMFNIYEEFLKNNEQLVKEYLMID